MTTRTSMPTSTARGRRIADRVASWVVTAGGVTIILSILGILLFILVEVWPLFRGAEVHPDAVAKLGVPTAAIAVDSYQSKILSLGFDGAVRVADFDRPGESKAVPVGGYTPEPLQAAQTLTSGAAWIALAKSGKMMAFPIRFDVSFVGGRRVIEGTAQRPIVTDTPIASVPEAFAGEMDSHGSAVFVGADATGKLMIRKRTVERNELADTTEESWSEASGEALPGLVSVLVNRELNHVFGASREGELAWWDLRDGAVIPVHRVKAAHGPISKLAFLLGDRALVVGFEDGNIEIWFPMFAEGRIQRIERVREFPAHAAAITQITAAKRDKGFVVQDRSGMLGLYYSTSNRVLWTGPSPMPRATEIFYFEKGDGIAISNDAEVARVRIRNPHPEFSLGAVFGKVWYEDAPGPTYTWASTGGTDDYESKFSLVPLLVGTLKGTFYSLLLAIPIAILAAMYTSQFLHPTLRSWLKPVIEIMAALPSVVLGFLAGLWLAPKVAQYFTGILLMIVVVPLAIIAAGRISQFFPRSFRDRFLPGTEAIAFAGVIAMAISLCLWLSHPFESLLFGGSFQAFLYEDAGVRYDQRNCIVVGLAMGFAVIPIIFAIAEDAFSNVPRSLVSASLALGATRFETVVRVVLPSASPGIFAAVMVGFGRAVGETMIVLMAAGNTPIMSWNPFNGFRTLSANIATEISEAAEGSTHYRTLFLAALLLFIVTFVVNTGAELIRQRLRKKYATL
jgi:phosphate transport system permease protein